MDSILLSSSPSVLRGLVDMMAEALGPNDYVHSYVNVEVALLVIEASKRSKDCHEWFPHGKWATIQSIQEVTNKQLSTLFGSGH